MKKFFLFFVLGLLFAPVLAQGATINGATSELELQATITVDDDLVLTFVPGHGMNGADAYVYTDVAGTVEEDSQYLGTWLDDTSSYSASASTSNGTANGDVTVITRGFDYTIDADAMIQGLDMGDYGLAMGDAYAWPDWLRVDHAGTATITLDYTYTLDTTDTCDNAEAYVYMNAFFADHVGTNRLTTNGNWAVDGGGSNPDTTVVEYTDSIQASDSVTVTNGSVSWQINIDPNESNEGWFSLWAYGEAGVEVEPVPIPPAAILLASGLLGLIGIRRFRSRG